MAVYTTIDDPEAYFQTVIWTGNGSDDRAITLPGDTNMQPDLVWVKGRTDTYRNALFDAARGATKYVESDTNTAEQTGATFLKSFTSDGFTLGTGGRVNTNTETYVAMCWKEASGIFDIALYTGTDETSHTVAHNLGTIPHMMWVKSRDRTEGWTNYHHQNTDAPETDRLMFNTTAATGDYIELWYDTAPTSSVFTIGTDFQVDKLNDDYVAYLFSEKQGFSKFGSYVGNGANDGTFVYTGFRPAFLLVKPSSAAGSWNIYDNKRLGYNDDNNQLYADLSNAEGTDDAALLSNGFKWTANTGDPNSSGRRYIYAAFAEAPFVNSNGVPCNAR